MENEQKISEHQIFDEHFDQSIDQNLNLQKDPEPNLFSENQELSSNNKTEEVKRELEMFENQDEEQQNKRRKPRRMDRRKRS